MQGIESKSQQDQNRNENAISIVSLASSVIFMASALLSFCFIFRNWEQLRETQYYYFCFLSIFLFFLSFISACIMSYQLSSNIILDSKLRKIFVILAGFNLVKIYILLYQKFQYFGCRLKIIQKKLALINFCVQFCHFFLTYLVQFIIQYSFYHLYETLNNPLHSAQQKPNWPLTSSQPVGHVLHNEKSFDKVDMVTLYISGIVSLISLLLLIVKSCSFSCFADYSNTITNILLDNCCWSCPIIHARQYWQTNFHDFNDENTTENE